MRTEYSKKSYINNKAYFIMLYHPILFADREIVMFNKTINRLRLLSLKKILTQANAITNYVHIYLMACEFILKYILNEIRFFSLFIDVLLRFLIKLL